jgi:hypothetical protein
MRKRMLGANPRYVATWAGHVDTILEAGLNNDKRQRLLHLRSRTELDATNEFPRFGRKRETLHDERPRSNGTNEKSQLIAGFLIVPSPRIPPSCLAQLAEIIQAGT